MANIQKLNFFNLSQGSKRENAHELIIMREKPNSPLCFPEFKSYPFITDCCGLLNELFHGPTAGHTCC